MASLMRTIIVAIACLILPSVLAGDRSLLWKHVHPSGPHRKVTVTPSRAGTAGELTPGQPRTVPNTRPLTPALTQLPVVDATLSVFGTTANPLTKRKPGKLVSVSFELSEILASPDGYTRYVLAINGQTPGPTINTKPGDTLKVTVTNKLAVPTSIHWHGILQTGSNAMDGAAGVTQKPIAPGATYTYQFVTDAPGTYWYHSHVGTQYVDGIRGAIIVGGAPSDALIQLHDWYHTDAVTLTDTQYLVATNTQGYEPVPDNALINGLGQAVGCTKAGPGCNYAKVFAKSSQIPLCTEAPVTTGMRWRLINMAAFGEFEFSIDEHLMAVTAADGIPVDPVAVSTININAAQRYDFYVCRNVTSAFPPSLRNSPAWIRAVFIQGDFAPNASLSGGVLARLVYDNKDGEPSTHKTNLGFPSLSSSGNQADINAYLLSPHPAVHLLPANNIINLTLALGPSPATAFPQGTWNGESYVNPAGTSTDPTVPSILALRGTNGAIVSNADGSLGTSPTILQGFTGQIVTLTKGQSYQLVISSQDTGEHPIHLHGHLFYVLARGPLPAGPDPTQPAPLLTPETLKAIPLNYNNPIARDTVTIAPFGYIVLQFVANNPGVWFLHCHIDWHLEAGLAMLFNYVS